jgi:hypothetical protein
MVFSILPANTESAAYEIDNSLRFADGYLNRTTSTATSDKKLTLSFWLKNSVLGTDRKIIAKYADGNNRFYVDVSSAGNLRTNAIIGGTNSFTMITDRVLLDPSAWMHIVLAFDTTQGTAANRIKIYVNGVQETSFSTETYPNQNLDLYWQTGTGTAGYVGYYRSGDTALGIGYLADVNFIDGAQKEASDFGRTDDNGVWVPKKYIGTYGDEGFFLEFQQTGTSADASGKGADTSGNTNHFDDNSMDATDVTTDTPTNNFATLNPINGFSTVSTLPVTTEGNLQFDSNSSNAASLVSTIAPSNGKWYVEVKALTSTTHIGVSEVGLEAFNVKGQGASRPNINYQYGGGVEIDGSIIDNEATFTSNDILGFALNLDDGELIIYKNGTALNSGTAYNLHTNTTHGNTGFSVQTATGSGNTKASFNFGNPAFSISSGNADANGYGNFEYSVPSGYFALCTKNLAEYG